MKKKYITRIVDEILKKKLMGKGAVLIEGPKWCGKTTTAEQLSKSVIYIDDPEKQKQYFAMADINPKRLLNGKTPKLIDEWQLIPKIWDSIRFEIDHRDKLGQFILTGSTIPISYDEINHTGTGRFAWLLMRPMSIYESGESSGEISIKELFMQPNKIYGKNKLTLDDIAYLACRGGWPRAIKLDYTIALEQAYDYYDAIIRSDISKVDGITKNPERVKKLMRSLARNQGTQITLKSLCEDIIANDHLSINVDTIYSYINALKKIFVIEDMTAWNPNLRSKTAIRTSDTRYFIDPSIAIAALGLGPNDLISNLNTFGFIFETMCVRDLRIFADAINGKVYHYRDKSGLECDAVLHLRDGKFALIEIKLGGDKLIDKAINNLKKLVNKINTDKMKKPSFLMVLTAIGDYAYRRQDGIYIVPLGCLKN